MEERDYTETFNAILFLLQRVTNTPNEAMAFLANCVGNLVMACVPPNEQQNILDYYGEEIKKYKLYGEKIQSGPVQ